MATHGINSDNIKALIKNKAKFLEDSKRIGEKPDGPSTYFYQRVINETRNNKDYSSLFDNNTFIEHLYATLAVWGMHRMDENTKMVEFEDFKNSIKQNKELFIRLSGKKISEVKLEDLEQDILGIFDSLRVMKVNPSRMKKGEEAPKLVANSKIMHFLLPDLIPPMDRENVLSFFYGKKDFSKKEESEIFWGILSKFQEIAKNWDLKETDLKNNGDTPIPKIIDNAIIGFINRT